MLEIGESTAPESDSLLAYRLSSAASPSGQIKVAVLPEHLQTLQSIWTCRFQARSVAEKEPDNDPSSVRYGVSDAQARLEITTHLIQQPWQQLSPAKFLRETRQHPQQAFQECCLLLPGLACEIGRIEKSEDIENKGRGEVWM